MNQFYFLNRLIYFWSMWRAALRYTYHVNLLRKEEKNKKKLFQWNSLLFFQFIPHSIAYFKYDSTPWENLAEFLTKILDIYWYSTFSDLFSTAVTAKIFLSLLLAARWFESRRQQRRTLLATCDACSRLTEAHQSLLTQRSYWADFMPWSRVNLCVPRATQLLRFSRQMATNIY